MSEAPSLTPLEWTGDRVPFAKAFVAAQKATDAVKKASTNPAFKSKYADLAGVVEAVVPALNDQGIAVMQFPAFDGEFVSVTTELLHESGASVRSTLKMRPTKADPQGEGSAITYARRYSLLAMTGAAPEDDDANAASQPGQQRGPIVPQVKVSPQQAQQIHDLLRRSNTPPKVVLDYCQVRSVDDIPSAAFAEIVAKLEARLPQATDQKEAA